MFSYHIDGPLLFNIQRYPRLPPIAEAKLKELKTGKLGECCCHVLRLLGRKGAWFLMVSGVAWHTQINLLHVSFHPIPICITCSMYSVFNKICPKNHPNVGKYTRHGAFGISDARLSNGCRSEREVERCRHRPSGNIIGNVAITMP